MSLLDKHGLTDPTAPSSAPDQDGLLASIVGLDGPTMGQMEYYYDNPSLRPKGHTTHIPALDEHFKWMPGYTNLFTGWPGDGKSEWVRQLLLLQASYSNKKTLAFVPEDIPREAWYDALIHSLTGKNPDSSIPECLPKAYYKKAMEFVREYFFVVIPQKGQAKTPGHILDIFEAGRAKLGITHFKLDPWNKCDHSGMNAAGGFQPYLVKELGMITDWCVENQTCTTIVAHPKGQARMKGEARAVPDSDGVSGGQTWDDMMYSINAIYRPNKHQVRNDPSVAFYNHKIKNHRRMGAKPGSIGQGSENPDVNILFDWKAAQYTFNGVSPLADPFVQSIFAPELAARTKEQAEEKAASAKPLPALPRSMFEDEPTSANPAAIRIVPF